ncbi:MAG: HAD hydrolase-like protein [Nanoarchaeota archaeon]|nr:HAD hydrolase-like protein [Nanoarchaeota archaeon]MBU1321618.1 HAD hydrolase-like protein [Nanoarchaeota archaeon]MBU1597987.1 HAD hydrolase-like protein [Nanoarchaeota archaeon]MBU2440938.1 HAD hydrolase-like protein [Nanoarchaeota archaeon]
MTPDKKFRIVLSDAGDILFDTSSYCNGLKLTITELINQGGGSISEVQACNFFRPYKILSQTVMSMEEAINIFFKEFNINSTYLEFKTVFEQNKIDEVPVLFDGITQTLEFLNARGVPFYVLTNASETKEMLVSQLEKMVVFQLKQRGVYNPEIFMFSDYVKDIISSRDVGVKKPDPYFFYSAIRKGYFDRDQAVFIAHKKEEIFGAADQGISVAAFNYHGQNDADEISKGIAEHNDGLGEDMVFSHIFNINKFSDLLELI